MKVEIKDKTRFKSFKRRFKTSQSKAVREAGQYLVQQVRVESSYSPFPRKSGFHPYRVSGASPVGGRPWWGVAKVSGNFLKSIRGYLRYKKSGPTYTVDYGKNPDKLVVYVTMGTKVMIARDVILHTYNQPQVRKQISKIIEKGLREGVGNG